MKRIMLFFLVATIANAMAQAPVIKDDFSFNKCGWEENQTKTILNGTYVINANEDGDQSVVNFFLDPQKDYTISADFTQQNGLEDNGFGLVWGSSKNDFNLFMISSGGDYAVYSGDPAQLKSWKHADAIKPMGNVNQLRIESAGGKVIFFINGAKVEERKPVPLFGYAIGFTAFTKMKLLVDNFLFAQEQVIELPPGSITAVKKENIGPNINTAEDELGPVISADGKVILFARQNVPENTGGKNDDEDVWVSEWQSGAWTKARNMGRGVNTPQTDNLLAVSTDNNTLMFEEENQLMMRHRNETGWAALEKLGLTFKNELDHFVASLTPDGKAVLFSAKLKSNAYYDPKKEDGDLYVCVREGNKWSAPINLGKTINTPGEETSPFLSADGKTLYFSSNGRPGYGDQDIFVARRQSENWTDWSKPVNLGAGVNSSYFDAYYTMPASGDYAYFVSYDKGFGKADIFRIKLHDEVKPKAVTLVKGKVLNSKNNLPLAASIHFENLESGAEVGEARSDPKTGAFQIVLPFGSHYGVRAITNGFYSVNENLELKATEGYNEIEKDLMLVPIEVGETVKLNNVFFIAGQPTLKAESFPELDRLVTILKDNPGIFIQLEGHTDNLGSPAILQKLSEDRVETVKQYLVAHGIDQSRITGQGFGATRPLASGTSEEDRRKNRRVEFKILKK
ncbi:MAG TPA: OmpA family protein [Cyclobacteriaceae bacterium]|nr:OmpA family protein [Cyclobacteriaceae bacterium]